MFSSNAQTNIDSVKNILTTIPIVKKDQDSIAIPSSSSYFTIGVGIGNTLFGSRSDAINSKLFSNNEIIYSPNISYSHKSGFNVNATIYYLNEGGRGVDASQYAITPGYELPDNQNITFTVANAHYFIKDKFSLYASPIQNDFYTSLADKKSWLHPGIAIDYATGTYREQQYQRSFYDSTTNKLKSFSIIPSISHQFKRKSVFAATDEISFLPMLMLNIGNSSTTIQHKTNMGNRNIFAAKKGKLTKFQNTPFQVESIGLSTELSYIIGKFSIEPQFYLDYYLPSTDQSRVATVFNLNVLYSF